jgi:uncharacterized protein YydD (DUF2326 family)
MFLSNLVVSDKNGIVREITFKRGLNLVFDVTTNRSTESGNDIGKTTFLRSVDFCLGSDGSVIYTDPEFKTKNEQVYNYLKNFRVEFKLTLESVKGTKHVITRGLDQNPTIDGKEYALDLEDFKSTLGKIILGLKVGKPSYRQLIKKFIRIDNHEMSNTLKFLHPSNSEDVYEAIYLYLFGFQNQDLLTRKSHLMRDKRRLSAQKIALKEFSHEALKQILAVIETDISDLERKKANFEVTDSITNEIRALENLRKHISELSISISRLRIRYNLSLQTIEQLSKSRGNINPETIKLLYDEAKASIPTLQKSFEDVLKFHDSMISNKISFVQKSLVQTESDILIKDKELNKHIKDEKEILKALSHKGALADLQKVDKELNGLFEEKGKKISLIKTLDELTQNIRNINTTLSEINNSIAEFEAELEKKITAFNLIFAEISKKLYDEQYVLSFEDHEGKGGSFYRFTINNVKGNVGSGKKKGQTTALDLAYLEFLDKFSASTVRFILHDKLEEIHVNQLKTMFEIANGINGQYIVAILKDKIEGFDMSLVESNTILTLAENDKFLKLN